MTAAETAEPFKQPRQSWFWWAMMVLPCLFLVAALADLWWYFSDPESYPIGWEGAGWSYSSHRNFVVSRVIGMLPQVLCLYGFVYGKSRRTARLVKIGASVLTVWLLVINLDAFKQSLEMLM